MPIDDFDISGLAVPEKTRCRKCKLMFKSLDDYHIHLISSTAHCACRHCFAEFASPNSLVEHMRQYHPAEQDIRCKCGQRFTRAAGLISHLSANECGGVGNVLEIRRVQAVHKNTALKPKTREAVAIAESVATREDDDDLLYFEYPVKNGLPPDNPWSTEANYGPPYIDLKLNKGKGRASSSKGGDLLTSDVEEMGGSTHDAASEVNFPTLKPKIMPASSAVPTTASVAGSTATPVPVANPWLQAQETELDPSEWTKEKVIEQIALQQQAAKDKDKKNPFHPSCPEFDSSKHWNSVLHVYKCPYPRCGKTKPNRENFIQHLISPAHQSDEITCVVCLRVYNSPTAYTQHFESQGKKCRARNVGSDVISKATGGIINIVGENHDLTKKYGAFLGERGGMNPAAELKYASAQDMIIINKRREEAAKRHAASPMW